MAFDKNLAEILRESFQKRSGITVKKMFGGLVFTYREHMLVGIPGEFLMARIGHAAYADSLNNPHVL